MANKILIKRGLNSNLNSLVLQSGEPAFVVDTGKFYIGNGIQNVLINPYDNVGGLNTTDFFSKVKVNTYGQVVSQSALTPTDIPTLTPSKISGLGTAATVNTGTNIGNVPVINSNGKIKDSIVPFNTGLAFATYVGADVNVTSGSYVPINTYSGPSASYITLDSYGFLNITEAGLYLITYTISSATGTMTVSLGYGRCNSVDWNCYKSKYWKLNNTICFNKLLFC